MTSTRHINPDGSLGGWVANTAYVAPTAYIGEDVCIRGYSYIYGFARIFSHEALISGTIRKHDFDIWSDGKQPHLRFSCKWRSVEEWRTKDESGNTLAKRLSVRFEDASWEEIILDLCNLSKYLKEIK